MKNKLIIQLISIYTAVTLPKHGLCMDNNFFYLCWFSIVDNTNQTFVTDAYGDIVVNKFVEKRLDFFELLGNK